MRFTLGVVGIKFQVIKKLVLSWFWANRLCCQDGAVMGQPNGDHVTADIRSSPRCSKCDVRKTGFVLASNTPNATWILTWN